MLTYLLLRVENVFDRGVERIDNSQFKITYSRMKFLEADCASALAPLRLKIDPRIC